MHTMHKLCVSAKGLSSLLAPGLEFLTYKV